MAIATHSFAEITLPNSTILFSKTIYKDKSEGAEIKEEQIWYIGNKNNWNPQILVSGKHTSDAKLSPDGKNLLWFDRSSYTYEQSISTQNTTRLLKGFGARYSPSGKLIAFISQREVSSGGIGRSVEIYDRKNKQTKVIAEGKQFPSQYHSTSWITDNEIAFIAEFPGKPIIIAIFNLQGQQTRHILMPTNLSGISGLVLSPDRSTWLFQATNNTEPDHSRIYIMDMDGSGIKKIFEDGSKSYHFAPAWAPDGKHIAFSAGYEGLKQIIILNLRSRESKNLPGSITDWGTEFK